MTKIKENKECLYYWGYTLPYKNKPLRLSGLIVMDMDDFDDLPTNEIYVDDLIDPNITQEGKINQYEDPGYQPDKYVWATIRKEDFKLVSDNLELVAEFSKNNFYGIGIDPIQLAYAQYEAQDDWLRWQEQSDQEEYCRCCDMQDEDMDDDSWEEE